jgi:hypothetical protein
VLHFQGAIPFNLVPHFASSPQSLNGRPKYTGSGELSLDVLGEGKVLGFKASILLPLDTEDVTVERVLRWMKDNNPVEVGAIAV